MPCNNYRLSVKPFLENGHLLGLDLFGNVDVGFHSFIVGMAGPFHHHLRRDATCKRKTDECAAAGVGAYKFILRTGFFFALSCADNRARDGLNDFTQFAKVLQVFVHPLVGDDWESEALGKLLLLVFVEDKQKVWGTEEKAPHTLKELSDLYIKDYEELVQANGSGKETLFRYRVCQNRVLEFVSKEYGMKDIPLDDVEQTLPR